MSAPRDLVDMRPSRITALFPLLGHAGALYLNDRELQKQESTEAATGFTYLGCGASLPRWACAANSETFYVDCGRILSGTIDQKAEQCSSRCSALSGYVAFSVHDTTACFCLKTVPTAASTTPASSCSTGGNNIVYAQATALCASIYDNGNS